MWWKVPKIWDGGDCYILGGGPSLTKQFGIPEETVQAVKSGVADPSAYSPYMEFLHNKHVIGINIAFRIGNWIDMLYFGDKSFYTRFKHEIQRFPNLKVTCRLSLDQPFPNIKNLRRLATSQTFGLTTKPDSVRWNSNSGGSGINVAVHTGAKRIFLFGYDMQSTGRQTHWHSMYAGQNSNRNPYKTHSKCFPMIARDAKKLGIEIINVNPDSKISCFPKMELSEVKKLVS